MKKYWIYISIGVIAIIAVVLGGYYYMDNLGYFDKTIADNNGRLSLGHGLGGGVFIAIAKYVVEKVMAIFYLIISIVVAIMAFIGLGLFTFSL